MPSRTSLAAARNFIASSLSAAGRSPTRTLVDSFLAVAVKFEIDYGMTGYERALLYLFAIETGLRAGAIRSLTVSSVNWEHGSVFLPDEDSKNGEEVVVPLMAGMPDHLRTFTKNRLSMVKLFGGTCKVLTDKT